MYQNQSHRYSKKPRFTQLKWLGYLTFICLLICFGLIQSVSANIGQATQSAESTDCQFKIISTQVVKAEKQPNTPPSQGWNNVTLPDNLETRWKGYNGSVWYKIIWQRQCDTAENIHTPVAIAVDRMIMAGEVFSNQERIWSDRSLVEPLSRSWNVPRFWILPASSIHHGNNEILIRIISVYPQASGLGTVNVGTIDDIQQQHEDVTWERRTLYLINLIITLTLGVIGLLIWLLRPQETTFGWFALTSILWSLFISNVLMTSPLFNSLINARLNIVFLVIYVISFCIFTWRFAKQEYKKSEILLWSWSGLLCLATLFLPNNQLYWILVVAFISSGIIFLTNCLFFQIIAFKNTRADVRVLSLVLLIFIIICLHDIPLYIGDSQGFFWTPFAGPITALAISLILAWRIAQDVNHIEGFNLTLKQSVINAEDELKNALNTRHQLELENVKLQERINLSHDLHDGLGGSIVRSMIFLDHHEHVEKAQMMSILKLLRNDLRQVIDSGSSIGSKVAENPILWAAPIRHRFIQLFEDMDIESTWNFEKEWNHIPTPLQALTFARVAEEALTNIVKHSQANEVKVSLTEPDGHALILEIQDNGKGFDPNSVQEGLHVGLHSMLVRVKRIGGFFDISSKPNETIIRVSLFKQRS